MATEHGLPVRMHITSGTYPVALADATFDNSTAASEIWIDGAGDTVLHPKIAAQPLLLRLEDGSPRVHISNVRLLGQ
eukprot:3555472-Prymnesium_polylepis.1